ncbi:aminoglycoside 6-adenylyltransferase [Morganella morganii]|uniref:aminoglycoside 6-adenylyltransferase n=1 Tax=Morganella morganii TaxID=582 RepID=UPI0022308635|nr:aminoglycoside 6-adenylyltransferase [Morganella morganii]MDM8750764.1 aminoglycoside 6-adenylyltransferase [Morganella morganii]
MRTDNDIYRAIQDYIRADDNIRAAILNGSRANKQVAADKYQDFDIVFFVHNIEAAKFSALRESFFGIPVLQQCPDDMLWGNEGMPPRAAYTLLMIYEDGHRIDLTLFPLTHFASDYRHDSLTIPLADKDGLFADTAPADESSYFITPPDSRLFAETANEFWWCATNVAKGLARHEITCAKAMTEDVIRPVFTQMLDWKIGCTCGFNLSTGKNGKYLSRYLTTDEMQAVLNTYSDAEPENNWRALFLMCELFREYQTVTAETSGFDINTRECDASVHYLRNIYKTARIDKKSGQ